MKKILSIIFAFILIFSCFAVSVFAEDMVSSNSEIVYENIGDSEEFPLYKKQPVMSFAEDYSKLYVDGEPFSRFDASLVWVDFGYTVLTTNQRDESHKSSAYLDLTDEQEKSFRRIYIEANYETTMYRIEFYYGDGSSLTVYYIKDTLFEDYEKIVNDNADKYLIDFQWPDGNIVSATKSELMGELVTLSEEEIVLSTYEFFYVDATNEDSSITAYVGVLCLIDDAYYYIDCKENNIEDTYFLYGETPNTGSFIKMHKITDEALNEQFANALDSYYGDDYGIFFDDDATEKIAAVFFIITFGILPLVVFVIFLIKAIRGKGIYKKLYITVSALSMAEVIVFTILAIIIAKS